MATYSSRAGGDGPDWFDIAATLEYLNETHSVTCSITVTASQFGPARLTIVASAVYRPTLGEAEVGADARVWSVEREALTASVRTLPARCLSALYDLDYVLLRELWQQRELGLAT